MTKRVRKALRLAIKKERLGDKYRKMHEKFIKAFDSLTPKELKWYLLEYRAHEGYIDWDDIL
jgi:hypothetical protein